MEPHRWRASARQPHQRNSRTREKLPTRDGHGRKEYTDGRRPVRFARVSGLATPLRKRSWPLLALGACAFVPGLGVLFGAAAVTWGLVSHRPLAKWAVMLGGAGALLNLVGGAVLIKRFEHTPVVEQSRIEMTRRDLGAVVWELERYRGRSGRYPATLQQLVGQPIPVRLLNIYDQTAGVFVFPRVYEYHLAADGSSYDLFALGPDGKPGTPDDVRPAIPDSLLEGTGYRPVH